MPCRYNAVNFLLNPHKTHPIARPIGRDMGCNLWFDMPTFSLLQSMQCCMEYCVTLDCIIMALECTWKDGVYINSRPWLHCGCSTPPLQIVETYCTHSNFTSTQNTAGGSGSTGGKNSILDQELSERPSTRSYGRFTCTLYIIQGDDSMGKQTLIARFMGPTCDPSGADRTQVGPMLAPWNLLSGKWDLRS